VNTLLSAIGLAEKGYEVDLLSGRTMEPDNDLIERAGSSGVRFIYEERLVRDIHPVKDITAFFRVLGFLRRNRYDIVHAHSSKAGLICRMAAKCAGVKNTVYTPHGHVFYGYFGRELSRMVVFAEALLAHITDRTIGLTPAECDEWLRFGIGKKDMYEAIPSGIEFDRLELEAEKGKDWRKELGIPREAPFIGSTGRFAEVKGYKYFIRAAAEQVKKHPDTHFLLAGDGPLRGEFEKIIKTSGIEKNFHIIDWQENAGSVIKAFDVFVLSSLNEGMGRALIEAMFLCKPVIATRVGGVPSVVSKDTGALVEPASSQALAAAMDRLLSDRGKLEEMGRKARERALAGYSAGEMVNRLDKLYRELLENNK